MNLDFKTNIGILLIGGIGYAIYTGQMDGFLDGFGGALGSGGSAANNVPME
ncbi:MAG: hypothetical protein GY913_11925 [Proteobacteria bacterium]|nr:hypothetical protein [Pseudomonadota bacterium]MCP4917623.1 hypothetical protein [Pseudomonadota bacterium]